MNLSGPTFWAACQLADLACLEELVHHHCNGPLDLELLAVFEV